MKNIRKRIKFSILIALSFFMAASLTFYFIFKEKVDKKIKNLMRGEVIYGSPDIEKNLTEGVPIVLTIDDGYAFQALVTITSLLKSANERTFYKINILVPSEFKQENKDMINSTRNSYQNKCEIEFIDMKDSFQGSFISKQFSNSVYYRLRSPTVMPQRKRCIYLDADIVVNSDLTELYNSNLEGNWIAGVYDGYKIYRDEKEKQSREDYKKEIGIKDLDCYINSGVLLWDLDAMRENKVEDKFCNFIKTHKDIRQHDQTTINVTCYGKILPLSFRYNVQIYMYSSKSYGQDEAKCSTAFTREDWKEGWNNPVIIHYGGEGEKPWNFPVVYESEKWWVIAKESPYFGKYYDKFLDDAKIRLGRK